MIMKTAVIFGAASSGRAVYEMNKDSFEIICFVDSDESKWGRK